MDMEKVVKAWEAVLSRDPLDAPWDLIDDTLTLLKEQEAAYQGAEELLRQKTILFDDAIKRLKEQEAVVRCGDCKHNARCEIAFGCSGNREWFCADGEMKPTQTNAKNNALDVR